MSALEWHCWEQSGDPYPFKADADREVTLDAFARWSFFCTETFGEGSAGNLSPLLLSSNWRWVAARSTIRSIVKEPSGPVGWAGATFVSRFGFRSEIDRFVFVLAASGE